MDAIFFIKNVGNKQTITSAKGEHISKLTIVITTKECRMGDNGTYTSDQDFAVDLLGDRADNFNLSEGAWIVGSVNFSVREYQGNYFQEIRLSRYAKL